MAQLHPHGALPDLRHGRNLSHRDVLQSQAAGQSAKTPSRSEDSDRIQDCQPEGRGEGYSGYSSQCLDLLSIVLFVICNTCK